MQTADDTDRLVMFQIFGYESTGQQIPAMRFEPRSSKDDLRAIQREPGAAVGAGGR